MSPEIILLAIGCYLFCGIEEKIYRIKTGDWRVGNYEYDFSKELPEFIFVPQNTNYDQVIGVFGNRYFLQRTHRVKRRQEYDGKKYYFDRELLYISKALSN